MSSKDREIEIGNMDLITDEGPYSSPKSVIGSTRDVESVAKFKTRMEYSFFGLILVTLIPAVLQSMEIVTIPIILLNYTTPIFWLATVFYVFKINMRVNSVGDAIFRVIISLFPLFLLYVVYRSSYDSNKYIRKSD